MKRICIILLLAVGCIELAFAAESDPETLLLKDYHPQSIYNIPQTTVKKAKYPAIDMHEVDTGQCPSSLQAASRWGTASSKARFR